MNKIRLYISYLPYIAIIFALIYLDKIGYTIKIANVNYFLLVLSVIFLLISFIMRGYIWRRLLFKFNICVSLKIAFISLFKTILTKFIPGKFWSILSQADIIASKGYSLTECTFISTISQLIYIATGLLVGFLGILLFNIFDLPVFFASIFLVAGIYILYYLSKERVLSAINKSYFPDFIRKLSNKKIPSLMDVFLMSLLSWFVLGSAFFIFIRSIGFNPGYYPITFQPLANNIGIITVIAPGGLLVREGVMISYLTLKNITLQDAYTISILSRIWFFAVEIILFAVGLFFDAQKKNYKERSI